MAINEKDQPGRDKDEARPERELGSSDDEDTEKVKTDSVVPGPNGRPGARGATGASTPDEEARDALDDEKRPPNADDR